MRYQVTMNNKPLSTHKNEVLARRALRRWMKKHKEERAADRRDYGWIGLHGDTHQYDVYMVIPVD